MQGAIFYFECNGAHWLQVDEISELTLFSVRYTVNRGLTQFFVFDEGFVPNERSNLSPYCLILQGEDFPMIWQPEENMRMVPQQYHDISNLPEGIVLVGLWLILTTDKRRPAPSSVVIEEAAADDPILVREAEAAAAIVRRREQAAEAIQAKIQQDDLFRQYVRDIRDLRLTLKYLQDEVQRLSIGDRRKWSKKRRNLDNQEIGDLRGHAEGIMTMIEERLAQLPPGYWRQAEQSRLLSGRRRESGEGM